MTPTSYPGPPPFRGSPSANRNLCQVPFGGVLYQCQLETATPVLRFKTSLRIYNLEREGERETHTHTPRPAGGRGEGGF